MNNFIAKHNLIDVVKMNDCDPIYFCHSPIYGECVLKSGRTETVMMKLYNDTGKMCKLYEYNEDNSIVLIERIIPGNTLRDIPGVVKRAEIFCGIFKDFHVVSENIDKFPTYINWVDDITQYMLTNEKDNVKMCELMVIGQKTCHEMADKYNRKYLLHGDFHHDNILLNSHGSYTVIDPKGVTGDPVFDTARYLFNELADEDQVLLSAKTISDILNIPLTDLLKLFFMEVMMGCCWSIEDGDRTASYLEYNTEVAFNILSRYC